MRLANKEPVVDGALNSTSTVYPPATRGANDRTERKIRH